MSAATDHALEIRKADTTDIPVISILAHAIWPDTYGGILNEAQIKHMLDLFYSQHSLEQQFRDKHVFLLAMMNAETVGFASYSHASEAGVYKVHKLYVHPMLHGKGLGRQLLDRIVHNIKPHGAKTLLLNVNRQNRALSFYEKYGFSIVGEEDIAIGEGYFMNDFILKKAL